MHQLGNADNHLHPPTPSLLAGRLSQSNAFPSARLLTLFDFPLLLSSPQPGNMAHFSASKFPYRDINVKVASDSYIFTSPSSPNAPALVIDRPTGDVRLSEPSLQPGKRVTRVSSIAGILGIIQLRLGQ